LKQLFSMQKNVLLCDEGGATAIVTFCLEKLFFVLKSFFSSRTSDSFAMSFTA
jgi:hypothetical protein